MTARRKRTQLKITSSFRPVRRRDGEGWEEDVEEADYEALEHDGCRLTFGTRCTLRICTQHRQVVC